MSVGVEGLFTMSMFLGVAVMQWFTGLIASIAQAQGMEIFAPVLLTIAALLTMGTLIALYEHRVFTSGAVWGIEPPRLLRRLLRLRMEP